MAESFTMFAKVGDVCDVLCEDDRRELLYALGMYGLYGEEVEISSTIVKAVFIALKEDVANSKQMRKMGSKGGRPRSDRRRGEACDAADADEADEAADAAADVDGADGVSEDAEPAACAQGEPEACGTEEPDARGNRKPVVPETAKPGVSESAKPVVSENAKPGVSEKTKPKPDQTRPDQSRPDQTMGVGRRAKGARFRPPDPAEVAEYAEEAGLSLDAGRFCDFYASKGWLVGRSPMRDWKAAARNWARDGGRRDATRRGAADAERDEYSLL